jgi:phospholipase C
VDRRVEFEYRLRVFFSADRGGIVHPRCPIRRNATSQPGHRSMTSSNRRDFLRLAAASIGAASVSSMLPPSIRKALALPANNATGTIRDIEHIVILMQENRSFDHYFGTLRGVRGFGDPRPIQLPGGQSVWHQPNGTDHVLPFRPRADNLGMQYMEGTPHGWTDAHGAWNRGRYDQWIPNKGTTTMSYFQREDIPFHYALADAFTICDAYHCSLMGSTDPNRYHMWTGWVGNDGSGGGPVIDNAELGYAWSTYPERLETAGISWKIYQDIGEGLDAAGSWGWTSDPFIGNYGDNSLLYFDQYRNAQPGDALYEKARTGTQVVNQGSYFDILKSDVRNGSLPQISWIVAPEAFSEHPNWPANFGAWYVAQVLDILTSNPELWSRTALFITYDENDGFFDHVVPPHAPWSGDIGLSSVNTRDEYYAGGGGYAANPYGLGNRVPMIVVSPWTRGGWVCSQVFDHTSLIRFIEARFGTEHPDLIETNITPWRRAVCGDLTSAFNFIDPNTTLPSLPPTFGYAPPDHDRHSDYDPIPSAEQSLPKQEPGVRPARPLPYAFAVSGHIDIANGRYIVDFTNTGETGAVFQVYSGNRADGPWTYTTSTGTAISDHWSAVAYTDGIYQLSVYGPNGFLYCFNGNIHTVAADGGANPEVRASHDAVNNNLVLQLHNSGSGDCVLTLSANHYSSTAAQTYPLPAGQSLTTTWPLSASANWYDLSIASDRDTSYLRRLAGHIETGNPSTSDPAIGDRIFDNSFE